MSRVKTPAAVVLILHFPTRLLRVIFEPQDTELQAETLTWHSSRHLCSGKFGRGRRVHAPAQCLQMPSRQPDPIPCKRLPCTVPTHQATFRKDSVSVSSSSFGLSSNASSPSKPPASKNGGCVGPGVTAAQVAGACTNRSGFPNLGKLARHRFGLLVQLAWTWHHQTLLVLGGCGPAHVGFASFSSKSPLQLCPERIYKLPVCCIHFC